MPELDPFRATPDVAAYAPRAASERALAQLAAALRRAGGCAVLRGPAGIGKTLVAHLAAAQLGSELDVASVPISSLEPGDLWAWVAGSAHARDGGALDARAAVLERARSGRGLLLAIDDAELLPNATRASIAAALDESGGALRALFVAADGERGDELVAELAARAVIVELDAAMSPDETASFVAARLAGLRDRGAAERFTPETVARIHELAEGNPARVIELCDVLVRPEETARAHEHARLLRPDAVASGIAQRSRESVERVADLSDEDLALAVARRRNAPARASNVAKPARAPLRAAESTPRRARRDALPLALGGLALAIALAAAGLYKLYLDRSRPPAGHTARLFTPTAAEAPASEPNAAAPAAIAVREAPAPDRASPSPIEAGASIVASEPEPAPEAQPEPEPARETASEPIAAAAPLPARKPALAPAPAATPERARARAAAAPEMDEEIPPEQRAIAGRRPPSQIALEPSDRERVRVRIEAPQGTSISIDGADYGEAPLAEIELDAGIHRFVARGADGVAREHIAQVDAANRRIDLRAPAGR